MSNLPLRKSILMILIVLICGLAIAGCGGGSTGPEALPGTGTQAMSSPAAGGSGGHLVGAWKVAVDVASEKMTFTPVDPAEAGVSNTQSRFQLEDSNVSLTGTATWTSPILSGNVTLTNNSADPLYFPMVMVTQISEGSVTVANEDFFNGPNPTWKYDNLAAGGSFPVQWQFSDPGGVDFTFYVHVFAWAAQTSGTANHLLSVQFADVNTGIAVGTGGTVIHTSDGGATWRTAILVPYSVNLYGVDMGDADIAWAVGGGAILDVIWRTTDGGFTWEALNPPALHAQYFSICSLDALNSVAVGSAGTIVRTFDGGESWSQASTVPVATNMRGVSMIDANTGWAVGDNGAAWTTSDGGDNWTTQTSGTPATLRSVSFVDANNGTAVGYASILHTTNGGATWTSVGTTGTKDFTSVRMLNANEAWTVGLDAGVGFEIYHIDYTNDTVVGVTGGTSGNYLYGLGFGGDPTNGDGWAVGTGGLLLH